MILKHLPADFIVEEILPEGLIREEGPFLLLSFTKTGRNTEDVVQDVSRALHSPRKFFGICGNKDRHARTTQFLSINRQLLGQMKPETAQAKLAIIRDASFSFAGFLDRPLSLGLLAGNRFQITVRDLSGAEAKKAINIAQQTAPNDKRTTTNHKPQTDNHKPLITPNYFDEQRFSGQNLDIGRRIVKKDFKGAANLLFPDAAADPIGRLRSLPKKTLLLYVHAYQSWLWNETAAEYLKRKTDCYDVPYSKGIFRFPKKAVKDTPIPLVGFGTDIPAVKPAALMNIVQHLLEEERLAPSDFVIRQVPEITSEGGKRDLIVEPQDFSIALEEDELFPGRNKAVLSFRLPPGSYATMVCKALFN